MNLGFHISLNIASVTVVEEAARVAVEPGLRNQAPAGYIAWGRYPHLAHPENERNFRVLQFR